MQPILVYFKCNYSLMELYIIPCRTAIMADDSKYVLVIVGTTSFDRLIEEVTSKKIVELLKTRGYKELVIQYGRGEFIPKEITDSDFRIKAFRYKDSLRDDIADASLVISHAGAGTVTETLGAGRPLVVIINELLMGNHQLELAYQLANDGHLLYGTCSDLFNILKDMDVATVKPYTPGDPQKFASFLDKFMGVS